MTQSLRNLPTQLWIFQTQTINPKWHFPLMHSTDTNSVCQQYCYSSHINDRINRNVNFALLIHGYRFLSHKLPYHSNVMAQHLWMTLEQVHPLAVSSRGQRGHADLTSALVTVPCRWRQQIWGHTNTGGCDIKRSKASLWIRELGMWLCWHFIYYVGGAVSQNCWGCGSRLSFIEFHSGAQQGSDRRPEMISRYIKALNVALMWESAASITMTTGLLELHL